jgi:hypothetical protein
MLLHDSDETAVPDGRRRLNCRQGEAKGATKSSVEGGGGLHIEGKMVKGLGDSSYGQWRERMGKGRVQYGVASPGREVGEGKGGRCLADSGPAAAGTWAVLFVLEQGSGREADRCGRAARCQSAWVKWYLNSLNRFKQTSNHSNFNWSKNNLFMLKSFK